MFALERQKKILEILEVEGSVSVNKLSTTFDVTEETVRRGFCYRQQYSRGIS